jgi:hypothetical protein
LIARKSYPNPGFATILQQTASRYEKQMDLTAKHREFIVKTWIRLGREPVGAIILGRLQRALAKQFGSDLAASPASIARVLADEGAELRHPEVIETDASWREKRFKRSALSAFNDRTGPLTLERAEAVLKRLEDLRRELSMKDDVEGLQRLREAALNAKTKAQLLSRDHSLRESLRGVQEEINEWFHIWLQTPEIFVDWLDLRRRSPEFRKRFATEAPSDGAP